MSSPAANSANIASSTASGAPTGNQSTSLEVPNGPGSMRISPIEVSVDIPFPVCFEFRPKPNGSRIYFDLRRIALLKSFQFFESVEITGAEMFLSVPAGANNYCKWGVDGRPMIHSMAILSMPNAGIVRGAAMGANSLTALPSIPTRFGTQLKAITPGNSAPVIHLHAFGDGDGQDVVFRMLLHLRCRGLGLFYGLNYNTEQQIMAVEEDEEDSD